VRRWRRERRRSRRSLTMRAMVSVLPPAAYGTTAVIGRVGQSPACAVHARSASAPTARKPAGSARNTVAADLMGRRWQIRLTSGPLTIAGGRCGRQAPPHHRDAFSAPPASPSQASFGAWLRGHHASGEGEHWRRTANAKSRRGNATAAFGLGATLSRRLFLDRERFPSLAGLAATYSSKS
jgi:hypothetical protein